MDQMQVVIVVLAILLVAGVLVWVYSRRRRTKMLRERFGPEYDRVVNKEHDPRMAEDILEFRQKKRETLRITPLSPTQRSEFAARWPRVQAEFVDDPKGALSRADELVIEVMQARGYPMADFEQRADVISVDHPMVVQNYRAGHEIALRHSRGQASTEDLRRAMVHYRALFEELLETHQPQRKGA